MHSRYKNFTFLITKINRCIHQIKSQVMSEFNLKSSHVSCLYYIYKENTLTAKELCDMCAEDKAAVSRAIVFLESEGYITCDSDAKKRYRALLRLTSKGQTVAQAISNRIDEVLSVASSGVKKEDRNIMYESLKKILNNLETYEKGNRE